MARHPLGKIIEKITVQNLRQFIKEHIPIKGVILDNGSGLRGSWEYDGRNDIYSIDKLYGDDCTNLKFEDTMFDMVVFSGVLQYVKDYKKAMKENYRVLKPKGLFLITILNKDSLLRNLGLITKQPKDDEYRLFTIKEIESLLEENKFEIIWKQGISFMPMRFNLCSNLCYLCRKQYR